jgi:hypothetical protein
MRQARQGGRDDAATRDGNSQNTGAPRVTGSRAMAATLRIGRRTQASSRRAGLQNVRRIHRMSLHPDFPVVEGLHQLTPDWALTLEAPFNRRIEDGDLVLWRPGLTVWMTIWLNDENASIESRLEDLKQHMSPEATDVEQHAQGQTVYYAYRLAEEPDEDTDDGRLPGYYGYAFAASSHVQMAVYFDEETEADAAHALHRSLQYTGPA